MKVWIVNQFATLPHEAGGTRHYSLGRLMAGGGVEVEVISASSTHLRPSGQAEQVDVDGVRFVRLHARAYTSAPLGRGASLMSFAHTLDRFMRTRLDRPDVIVGSTPSPVAAWVAMRHAKRIGCPFVLEVRDLWPQSLIEIGGLHPLHPAIAALRLCERHLYRGADHIVTLMPKGHRHVQAVSGTDAPITWIPNGLDPELVRSSAFRREQNGPFVVRYAGTMGQANALDPILDAAAVLRECSGDYDVQFDLMGSGTECERLNRRVQEERLHHVRLVEARPRREVSAFLAGADALVVNMLSLPIYQYGISFNKLYDYMGSGRPTVIGSAAVNDPIAEAGAGLSVRAGAAEELAKAVRTLTQLPASTRSEMGRRGAAYVHQHHYLPTLAGSFRKVLENAVQGVHQNVEATDTSILPGQEAWVSVQHSAIILDDLPPEICAEVVSSLLS